MEYVNDTDFPDGDVDELLLINSISKYLHKAQKKVLFLKSLSPESLSESYKPELLSCDQKENVRNNGLIESTEIRVNQFEDSAIKETLQHKVENERKLHENIGVELVEDPYTEVDITDAPDISVFESNKVPRQSFGVSRIDGIKVFNLGVGDCKEENKPVPPCGICLCVRCRLTGVQYRKVGNSLSNENAEINSTAASFPLYPFESTECVSVPCCAPFSARITNLPSKVDIFELESWLKEFEFDGFLDIVVKQKKDSASAIVSFKDLGQRNKLLVINNTKYKSHGHIKIYQCNNGSEKLSPYGNKSEKSNNELNHTRKLEECVPSSIPKRKRL